MKCWWEEAGEGEELDLSAATAKTELYQGKLFLI